MISARKTSHKRAAECRRRRKQNVLQLSESRQFNVWLTHVGWKTVPQYRTRHLITACFIPTCIDFDIKMRPYVRCVRYFAVR